MKKNKIKNIFWVALAAFAVLLTPSCNTEKSVVEEEAKPADISLALSEIAISIPAEGGVVTVDVTTNAESWEAISAVSWAEVSCKDDTITIVANENTSNTSRVGDIIVVATTGSTIKERSISLEQFAAGGTTNDGNLTFECPVFEELVLTSFDVNGDGILSAEEAAVVTDLVLTLDETSDEEQEAITSLKGIKNFVNLVNLDCDGNLLTELDLSGLEKLEYVDCSYNNIKTFNVSGCKSLKWIYAYMNNISKFYFEGCNNLLIVQMWKNNLTSIDMSGMAELVYFDLRMNMLREAKFNNCPNLQIAVVGSNNLISLDLTGLPMLSSLGCYDNSIASLDVSGLTKLDFLECYTNNISTLDLSANKALTYVACNNNLIAELNINNCTALRKIDCSNNRLSGTFDTSKFKSLTYLSCGGNNFTDINVVASAAITDLYCANTAITALNVSTLKSLETLVANDCRLTTMDCSNNLKLSTLYLQGNPLTSLVLAKGQSVADIKLDNFDVISYK